MTDETTTVTDRPDTRRYEIKQGDTLIGFAEYVDKGGRRIFVHTEIDPSFGGEGYGSTLIRAALDDVRAHGIRIIPLCPFVAAWVERHPDFANLVDTELLNRIEARA